MPDLFAAQPPSVQDMLGCARRELAMRRKVYPGLIVRGRMKPEEAELEIRMMTAIVEHFANIAHV